MNQPHIPLRELKKAKTRIALYEAAMSLIGDRVFREVMLDDICRMAEVSRVTYFNLFRKKEDLLLYFMRIWLTGRIIDIQEQQLRGFEAVRHLYRHIAEQSREKAGIMPSLIAFLSEMKMHPCMPELSQAEVQLLFPGHEELGAESPDMFALFERCMSEAAQDGTLKPGVPIPEAIQFLFMVFYGAFLTSQLYASDDIGSFYEAQLKLIEN
ncbi:TetR/AcrR family transcriptional regulator [Paenibacillus sp. N3/727]|uniref:TetR/AcrR family transcriptional regulator n=1 Tax=Paenibacillus sp. N3/727 TaxID=2925845 RepID=UPI001F53DEDA|nr:TetR/AcrR family transcriptional regulator [Paenibacillus sp. N3/727]UNK19044.1 TetR/AcrR family transcriptional regulator [Paenibacillus sp. N3/727]